MKKQILIGSMLLAAITTYAQTGKNKPVKGQLINMKEIAREKFAENNQGSSSMPVPSGSGSGEVPSAAKSAAVTNTWDDFTASMNIYGVSISFTKPLQWNDDLNAVSFVH